jgi:hypothetical protein
VLLEGTRQIPRRLVKEGLHTQFQNLVIVQRVLRATTKMLPHNQLALPAPQATVHPLSLAKPVLNVPYLHPPRPEERLILVAHVEVQPRVPLASSWSTRLSRIQHQQHRVQSTPPVLLPPPLSTPPLGRVSPRPRPPPPPWGHMVGRAPLQWAGLRM